MARFLDETGLAYFWEKIKAFFQSHQQTIPEYTIEKKQTAEEGYTSSYVLKKDGTQVGATINIPKDYLVRSGEVKTVTVADEPYEGAAVGDKYLDFVVNTVDDSGDTSHIYIPVSDLCAAYNAGNGIQISGNNYISVKVNQNQSNGLGVGGEGLSLYVVTPSVNGVGGNNGAMTATDKEKLDGFPTNAKALQTAVSDPTASGTSVEFVSNIAQNENGEITPLKKTVRTMTASGQNHSSGLVPDPGSTAGTTRYLCENGTWSEPNGGGGGTSTPTDVQINGTSITSNNVANVQTEGVYNAVTNKIATMSDLPSTSGFALDSAVVHKTGDETVGGTKTFNSNVVLAANANLVLSTAQDEGVYIEANSSSGGQQALTFSSLDDDSAVRLENVAAPTNNTDAANKQYVDNIHKAWFYKKNLLQDAQINNTAQCDFEFNTAVSIPPAGVYMVTGQALISNPNKIENQAHVILRYRLTSSGGYTVIAASSVTLEKAMQSTDGGTYGATSVFLQGIIVLEAQPSYFGVEMLVEVETDGNYSYLTTTAPLSGSLVETLTEGATNIVMLRIGDYQSV